MTSARTISSGRDVFYRLEFKIYGVDTDEYDKNGINRKYYSLTGDEADKLSKSGKLAYVSEGFAFVRDVGEDGYWLEYYKVFDE